MPEDAEQLKFTNIVLVPLPETIVAPVGTVHKYVLAPFTVATKYVTEVCPGFITVSPVMLPGVIGIGYIFTARHVCPLVSHILRAFTHTLPELLPKVAFIDVVPCPELIVEPDGTDQV